MDTSPLRCARAPAGYGLFCTQMPAAYAVFGGCRCVYDGLRCAQPYATIGIRQPRRWVRIPNPCQGSQKHGTKPKTIVAHGTWATKPERLANTRCGVARESGRCSNTGICQIRVWRSHLRTKPPPRSTRSTRSARLNDSPPATSRAEQGADHMSCERKVRAGTTTGSRRAKQSASTKGSSNTS